MVLRVLIVVVWFKMMVLGNWDYNTAPFVSGLWFVLIWLYFAIQSIAWPKSTLCPLFHGCGSKWCKKEV